MMCKRHNRWFRVGEKCSLCEDEKREAEILEREIRQLEEENKQIILELWVGDRV